MNSDEKWNTTIKLLVVFFFFVIPVCEAMYISMK